MPKGHLPVEPAVKIEEGPEKHIAEFGITIKQDTVQVRIFPISLHCHLLSITEFMQNFLGRNKNEQEEEEEEKQQHGDKRRG